MRKAKSMAGFRTYFVCAALAAPWLAGGTENVPRSPYAQWANVPDAGQLKVGLNYQESEAYYIWDARNMYGITVHQQGGERYGIDIRQGYVSFDYGINEKWAADLSIGYTTVGWRAF